MQCMILNSFDKDLKGNESLTSLEVLRSALMSIYVALSTNNLISSSLNEFWKSDLRDVYLLYDWLLEVQKNSKKNKNDAQIKANNPGFKSDPKYEDNPELEAMYNDLIIH